MAYMSPEQFRGETKNSPHFCVNFSVVLWMFSQKRTAFPIVTHEPILGFIKQVVLVSVRLSVLI
jgi:hypothetical protein